MRFSEECNEGGDNFFKQDMENLMEKAKEMVALATKLSAQVNKEEGGSNFANLVGTSLTTEPAVAESDNDLRPFMLSMGIDNPVTKKRAGNLYHTQLAREVAAFSEVPWSLFAELFVSMFNSIALIAESASIAIRRYDRST